MGLGVLDQIGWRPNTCRACTPEERFRLPDERGSGRAPDGSPCPRCNGSGYGPQLDLLLSQADELLAGGPKGWGKSSAGHPFLLMGNPDVEDGPLERVRYKFADGETRWLTTGGPHYSYAFHPEYQALVTRRNEDDVSPWVRQFAPYAEKLGARWVGRPVNEFRFPSRDGVRDGGGVISLSHMKDESSYQKYQGAPQLHRWLPEELGQLADEDVFESVVTNMRTKVPELRVRVLGTANPEGPGLIWIGARFVDLQDADGRKIPHGTLVRHVATDPLTGQERTRTRQYITASLLDNPHLGESYIANINAVSDPRRRRALLLGDWSAASGAFFPELRRVPIPGEPPNALHVYDPASVRIEPWWRRGIGMDWGYGEHNFSVHWAAQDPSTGRIYVYREMTGRRTAARKVGAMLAEASFHDLHASPDNAFPLWLSHEAFGRGNEEGGITRTAQLIQIGIGEAIGENAVSSPDLELRELADASALDYSDYVAKYAELARRIREKRRYGIVVHRALVDRSIRWALLHDLMRWETDVALSNPEFDWDTWQRLGRTLGASAAVNYAKEFEEKPNHRPELQIHPECRGLLRGIAGARADKKNPEKIDDGHFDGRDSLDSGSFVLAGMFRAVQDEENLPREELWARRLAEFKRLHPDATASDRVRLSDAFALEHDRRERPVHGRLGATKRFSRATVSGRMRR